MATDSTELTFVRCPACRSLVPAMSSECRMCGANLDPLDEAAEAAEPAPARQRKKTVVFTPGQEFEEEETAPKTPPVEESAAPAEEVGVDPLSGFVEEPAAAAEPEFQAAARGNEAPQDPLASFAEQAQDEAPADSVKAAPRVKVEQGKGGRGGLSFSKPKPEEPIQSSDSADEIAPLSGLNEAQPLEDFAEPVPAEEPVMKAEADPLADLMQEVEETSSPAVDPLADFQEPVVEDPILEPVQETVQKPAAAEPAETAPVKPPAAEPPQAQDVQPVVEKELVEEMPEEVQETKEPAPAAPAAAKPEVKPISKPPKAVPGTGRLCGWLVSAESEDQLIELRGGRYFISGSQLKPTDIVIDSPSISTPHAMLLVADEGTCMVQDLMSDTGVFISPASGGEMQRSEERLVLSHGDRVIFGDLEFIVVLIPR